MIISHRYKFVFIHVAKTAGTTIKVYLSPHLGIRDLRLGAYKETMRAGVRPNLRTYVDVLRAPSLKSKGNLIRGNFDRAVHGAHRELYGPRLGRVFDHCGANEIAQFAPSAWKAYFKFCFIRNPYDRMVSYYKWKTKSIDRPPSFSRMLSSIQERAFIKPFGRDALSWDLYANGTDVLVDFVGRQEHLLEDMRTVCERIDIPFKPDQFTFNKVSSSRVSYRDYYSAEDKRTLEKIFERELSTFGYTF